MFMIFCWTLYEYKKYTNEFYYSLNDAAQKLTIHVLQHSNVNSQKKLK